MADSMPEGGGEEFLDQGPRWSLMKELDSLMILFFVAVPLAIGVGVLAYMVRRKLAQKDEEKSKVMSDLLGVPDVYVWEESKIMQKSEVYYQSLDLFEDHYCKQNGIANDEPAPEDWPQKLEAQKKSFLKMKLMERAVCYRQNIITKKFWDSIKAAEAALEVQFEEIKREAAFLEPGQDGNGIFREAVNVLDKFGIDGIAPKKKLPPAGQQKYWTDHETYEIVQTEKDIDMAFWVPYETMVKDVKVQSQPKGLRIMVDGKVAFEKTLLKDRGYTFKTDSINWELMKRPEWGEGDPVTLGGLSKAELNGKRGLVMKQVKETQDAGRIRVKIAPEKPGGEERILSIKPQNLTNHNPRKAAITVNIEKGITGGEVWFFPPWELEKDGSDSEEIESTGNKKEN